LRHCRSGRREGGGYFHDDLEALCLVEPLKRVKEVLLAQDCFGVQPSINNERVRDLFGVGLVVEVGGKD
jgi:hypothetical protein